MDQIRLDAGNDIVDNFPLKRQGNFDVFISVRRVNSVNIEKSTVFGQVDAVIRHFTLNPYCFFFELWRQLVVEKGTVIRHGDMDVGTLLKQRADQSSRYISKITCFGGIKRGKSSHAVRQIGNFRGNHKNPWIETSGVQDGVPLTAHFDALKPIRDKVY
jgi:hypothetical protein